MLVRVTALSCAPVFACSSNAPSEGASLPSGSDPGTPALEMPAYVDDACAHLRGGPPGADTPASDLGRAHALVRHFGPSADPRAADARLADALDGAAPGSSEATRAYASAALGTCAADADPAALGAASVSLAGSVAIVTPGTGDIAIPDEATAIALDVRALPDGDAADAAAERAIAAVTVGAKSTPLVESRRCNGQPDEVWTVLVTRVDQYRCSSAVADGPSLVGRARLARPLAVLTAPRLTTTAARAAAVLRVTLGAAVIGESVPTALAESKWIGVGESGLAVRTRRLLVDPKTPLPDVIPADLRTTDPIAAVATFDFARERAALGGAARPAIEDARRIATWGEASSRLGDARAALIAAYAAARAFFPYFDEVGDTIDARLDESLAMLGDPADRGGVRRALARFGEALHDGHSMAIDREAPQPKAFSPVALLPVGSDLVVALSSTAEAHPGDIVVSIDGVPTAAKLADAMKLVSGSPQAVRAHAAEHLVPARDADVVLEHPDGTRATVTLHPSPEALSTFGMYDRPARTLADLNAPDVYYVSLNSYAQHAVTAADEPAIEAAMIGKRGVVLDMRGYPDVVAWDLLAFVASNESFGPKMADLDVTPDARAVVDEPTQRLKDWATIAQGYTGPVVVLTGANTQSQAEHWVSFFGSKKRGKLVGEKTSGANGTITGAQLPGGYGFTFTGMVVKQSDGRPFHAIGHTPDVEVAPTIADLRDGKDTVLLRAIAEIP